MFESLLTLNEAASLLRLHPDTLKRRARQGAIPAIRMGKYWRFRESELDAWVRQQVRLQQTQTTPR